MARFKTPAAYRAPLRKRQDIIDFLQGTQERNTCQIFMGIAAMMTTVSIPSIN